MSFALADTTWQLPQGVLHVARGSAIVFRRHAALIADHPIERISVFRLTRGKVVSHYDSRAVTLQRGDMVLLDYALPIFSRSGAFACQSATVPRQRVALRGRRGDLHGSVLRGGSPLGTLLGRQLDALVDGMPDLDAAAAEGAIIQQQRLDAALKMLVRERPTFGLVKAVAERCAFNSLAHFSRAFTARFGRAPTDVVAMSHERVGGATFAEWLKRSGEQPSMDMIQVWLDGPTKR